MIQLIRKMKNNSKNSIKINLKFVRFDSTSNYAKIGNTENWPHIQMSLLFTLEIRVSESFQLMDNCFSDFDGSGVVVEF